MGMSQIPIGWLMKIEGFNNRFTPEKQPVCLMIDGINQLPAALFLPKGHLVGFPSKNHGFWPALTCGGSMDWCGKITRKNMPQTSPRIIGSTGSRKSWRPSTTQIFLAYYLNLLKMMFFSHGKSTTWGIYREYCLFFGGSLRKSMIIMFGICLVFLRQVWET